jgi:hypothetical protein
MSSIIRNFLPKNREVKTPPVGDYQEDTSTATAIAAGEVHTITLPEGFLYRILGLEIINNANQTTQNTEIKDAGGTVKGRFYTATVGAGTDLVWVNDGTNIGVDHRYGDVVILGGETLEVTYDQAVGLEQMLTRLHYEKWELN